jgi:hypothetical protein
LTCKRAEPSQLEIGKKVRRAPVRTLAVVGPEARLRSREPRIARP